MSDIQKNLYSAHEKIAKACIRHKEKIRDANDVKLIVVSKKQPMEKIKAALGVGHRVFGENRVQEAHEHWGDMRHDYEDLELHLIGPLQTNKVKEAVALFDVIQTVDRPKLVKALAKEMKKQDKADMPCFVQVNTGEEDQKSGVAPHDLPDFLKLCRDEGLNMTGLMCIPPQAEPAALHFAFLKKLADENNLSELSMGMSGDFEKAVPLGATYVRVGSAIFGDRI
jgi:pyridoxal phosphate enzyme (YggS family)